MTCTTSMGTSISLHQRHKRLRPSERRNMDLIPWLRDLQRHLSTWRSSSATPLPSQVETESTGTGQDTWSLEADNEGHFPEHLVIMVNGLGGSPDDWKFAAEQLVKRFPDKVVVHSSQCNTAKLTYDGVDQMGERLAEEVRSLVEKRRGVIKISFVAHSLGGLIARYAIGILYAPETVSDNSLDELGPKGKIAGLEPVNFITSATPHLGSRGNKQLPFLFGLSLLERTAVETAHLIIGRTGRHLFLTDRDDGKLPLLVRMAEDQDDIKFISALRAFKRRVAYANASFDHIVGWRTASIRCPHELPKQLTHTYNGKYPNIANVENVDLDNCEKLENAVVARTDDVEEKMIKGLTQVPWERVDVKIKKCRLKYNAHNTIQVRKYFWNSDGADVIFHMIDNFLNISQKYFNLSCHNQKVDFILSQQFQRTKQEEKLI
ncbi:hypothetical protein LUZ63_007137 [Rhynchospora breviuscula]|uniref:DUF676 domain-containing protein n=1 Tax=Rhynchospora breviuscula TaxID=2022672 RepID=A0A9Q0HUQ6_9POAL|nr:hypothetical protein LUZ63_007137 [Rhynchospora breviuscula]